MLLGALAIELLVAGWWRWPWTIAPIETGFDYGSGHVAVVSENWRRNGALRQHFLPVMSTDPDLPEWPFRTLFSQEYSSVPPLAFILHWAASSLLPRADRVLLAKLLAQALIATSVLASAALLAPAFDAWPIFVGLSFLVSGVPYLLWFSNGYFAVNVGLAAQLVLVGWCAEALASGLETSGTRPVHGAAYAAAGGVVAFLGAFADYIPVAANATAVAGLACLAIAARRRPAARRFAWQAATAVAVGTVTALAATVVLYSRQMGLDRYRAAIATRVDQRSGDAPVLQHLDVIRRQMFTAWPAPMLVALASMLVAVIIWSAVMLLRRPSEPGARFGAVVLFALGVAALPSLGFHYRAMNYVSLHWWFAGTWTIMFAVALSAFVDIIQRSYPAAARPFSAALVAILVAANVAFTAAQAVFDETHSNVVRLYREIGRALPLDGLPLVITDVTAEWPGLFQDFPFATAYLRRPIVLRDRDGLLHVPGLTTTYEGKPLNMGGEDVAEKLQRRGGDVYIAYDPDARRCAGPDVPLTIPRGAPSLALCRAQASLLVDRPVAVLGDLSPEYVCSAPPLAPTSLHVVANQHGRVTVAWAPSATRRASYVLEVGRAPGESGALVESLGRATEFTAGGVNAGRYFVRVRGRNSCGTGPSSNELVVDVK